MTKAINIREFEQTFRPEILKKGLSILKKNMISDVKKQDKGVYVFGIGKDAEIKLTLRRSGEKITDYSCSCRKSFCEHLCAAIFYFQKELFGELVIKTKQSEGQKLFKQECKIVKQLLDSKDIKQLIKKQRTKSLYFHLALINEISLMYSSEFTGAGNDIYSLIRTSESELAYTVKKGLNKNEKQAWILAAKNSISSSRRFNTKLFLNFIPYASLFFHEKPEAEEFKEILHKRKLKLRFPSEPDWREVALNCIDLSPVLLKGRSNKTRKIQFAEEFIALAKIEQAKNKTEKAIKILKEGLEQLKQTKPASLTGYLEFSIQNASECEDTASELLFIEQLFIYDSHIHPLFLLRAKALLDENEKFLFFDRIITVLETKRESFSKIAELLMSEGRYDELVQKIRGEKNAFRLLNSVMIKKLPVLDELQFNLYVKQFKEAIAAALETHYQQLIFNNARIFIDQLPEDPKEKLLKMILNEIGKHSYLYSYILKLYPELIF